MKYKNDYEYCWETGNYTDSDCMQCPHYTECSASGYKEEENEDDDED